MTLLRRLLSVKPTALARQSVAILRSYGTNAHVYLPGANGVAISGLNSGNYTDQTLTTYAAVDGTVGGVVDPLGAINATQTTTANRPMLNRGLYNLLTYSQDFSNAAWSKTDVTATTGEADPYGGTSATAFYETVTNGGHNLSQLIATVINGAPYTQALIVKSNGRDWIGVYCNSPGVGKFFNITTGAVGNDFLGTPSVASIAPIGGGWYLVAVSATTSSTTTGCNVYASPDGSSFGYAGDVSKGFIAYRAGLFKGTLTAQQILAEGGISLTTSTAASNSSAGRYSWQVDTDDSLLLGSVPFQFTDDYFVCIGAACNNKASYPGVLDVTGGTARMYLYFDASGVVVSNYKTDAAVDTYVQGPAFADGKTGVISMYKQSGQVCTGWNGVDGTPAAAPAGTYTITTTKLSNLLDGLIAPAVFIKGTVSAADRLTLERWVASLTPAGPTF